MVGLELEIRVGRDKVVGERGVCRGRSEGDGRPRMVGIEIKEIVGLRADKVVRAGGTAASDAYALGKGEERLERG